MSREIGYFCPKCQAMELQINSVVNADGAQRASCLLCKWEGDTSELIGAVSPENEKFWTGERVGSVMVMALAKHGAGPLIQAMELVGILPRVPDLGTIGGAAEEVKRRVEEHASAQDIRDAIMQAVIGAAVSVAFETAAAMVPQHLKRFGDPTGGNAERLFSFADTEVSSDN